MSIDPLDVAITMALQHFDFCFIDLKMNINDEMMYLYKLISKMFLKWGFKKYNFKFNKISSTYIKGRMLKYSLCIHWVTFGATKNTLNI